MFFLIRKGLFISVFITTPPLAPAGSTNKQPKEQSTIDDGDSDLSSLVESPVPKHTKQAEKLEAALKKKKPEPKPVPALRPESLSTRGIRLTYVY